MSRDRAPANDIAAVGPDGHLKPNIERSLVIAYKPFDASIA